MAPTGGIGVADVRRALDLGEDAIPILEGLAGVRPTRHASLPEPSERANLLHRLGIPAADAGEMLAAWPAPRRAPEAWWLIERGHARLTGAMGDHAAPSLRLPSFAPKAPAIARYLPVFVHLAALPDVLAYHADRGVSERVTWATLRDLGRHVAVHRRTTGIGGLDAPWWLPVHFRGVLFELGRLQFTRSRISPGTHEPGPAFWYPPSETDALGAGFAPGDAALGIHIPDGGGLAPDACTASLADATAFFPRHFPDEPVRIATCTSWLLDPQLADYLPATSNIVQFQRRFELVPGEAPGDDDVLQFVFRRPAGTAVEDLPRRTSLERAVVDHLRAGRHWALRTGWLPLPEV